MPAAVAAVAAVASAVVSAAGAIYSGQQQKKAAEYNAAVQEQQAQAIEDKAKYDEEMHRERVRKILSTQRAMYGKSGIDTTGSPLLVMEDTFKQGEVDALAIRYGGDIQSAQARSAANLSRMQGKSLQTASYFQAGSSLLAGAGQAAGYFSGGKATTTAS